MVAGHLLIVLISGPIGLYRSANRYTSGFLLELQYLLFKAMFLEHYYPYILLKDIKWLYKKL